MDINQYQDEARKTAFYPLGHISIPYCAIALCGETGELANNVKKMIRDDGQVLTAKRRESIIDELGDVLWYCAALAHELKIDLSDVCQKNLDKLARRHMEG